MSRRSKMYESLCRNIVDYIKKDLIKNGDIVCINHDTKMLGESGFWHQIDVSFEYSKKGGANYLILVECKLRDKEKIGIAEVLVFHSRISDIQGKRNSLLHRL